MATVASSHGEPAAAARATTTCSPANRPLAEALEREGAGWAAERCSSFGPLLGGEPLEWGRLANENPPKLRTHDRFGERIDEVEFHPAWHELMRLSLAHGLHSLSWTEGREGAHVARAALFVLASQVEAGHGCPVSMTHAAVPALRESAARARRRVGARLTSRDYDFGLRPVAEKRGAVCGMAMTERQGGSDVRANTTTARPLGGRRRSRSTAPSGSARRRCPTPSSCSRRRRAASPASCSHACSPTGRATRSGSSA